MRRRVQGAVAAVLSGWFCTAVWAAHAPKAPHAPATTAAEVIARNVAARGGLEAWRKVNTLVWLGHVERAGAPDGTQIPFVMQVERPNKTRFEIKAQHDEFTRIFDGAHGWKVRPSGNGQPDLKSFSPGEVEYSRDEFAIDGPLIDYQAKGVTALLDGIDTVEGRRAYRLSLKLASGAPRKVWIDLASNLEVRYDRPANNPLAPGAPVSTYYRDYKTVDGLKLPSVLEISAGPSTPAPHGGDKLVVDQFIVNPKFDALAFSPPPTPMRHGGKVLIPGDGMPVGMPGRSGP